MRILIADDDGVSRALLEAILKYWGHEVVTTTDGLEAHQALQRDDAPSLAILDWLMPGLDGPEVCRKLRKLPNPKPLYILLLTVKDQRADIISGLEAGADDYVTKPFDQGELKARIQAGERLLALQGTLASRVVELEAALTKVKQLTGLLPICSYCKKIRDDKDYWREVEVYVGSHSGAEFTHSICPTCFEKELRPVLEPKRGKRPARPGKKS